ncbi:MAG: sporulation protein YqfD [Oscillospiraceae bacterium]|nr:sporulation protein YqfD [Oscillospiraceae bacterium]
MYKRAANFLRGSVLVRVECAWPERVVNLCSAHGVPFWDIRWENAIRFTLRTTRDGARRLRTVAEPIGAQVAVLRQSGAPALLLRLRRRYALLGGAAVLLLLLTASNFFIWDFEVTGNETVPAETILRALERQGVTVGCPGLSVNQEQLRNHVLLELRDVSWLAVNVKGCVAHVQVVERHRPPPLIRDRDKTNVVAARDGLVTRVEALDGQAEVLPGTTVTRGQLLISGVTEAGSYGLMLTHGMGSVWARTWYELSAQIPLRTRQQGAEAASRTEYALIFGKHRIKICGKGSVTTSDCDKITRYNAWTLPGGLRLPVTVAEERYCRCRPEEAERSPEEARQEGEELLLRQLRSQLGEDASVTETRFAAARQGDWLLVTLKAECLEQIGVSVPLIAP